MNGSAAETKVVAAGYQFMSIINNTDNVIQVYDDRRPAGDANVRDMIVEVPYYTSLTLPIRGGQEYTFIYTDGGAVGTKVATVIFAVENLNINSQLGNPSSGGAITIQADAVGLARQAQLPAALTAGGNLATEVLNTVDVNVATLPELPAGDNNIGNVDVLTLPDVTIGAALPAGDNNIGNVDVLTLPELPAGDNNIGNVDVVTLPPLPAGTNNIGDVDVVTLPAVTLAAKTAVKVTSAAGGDETVKASAGAVYGVRVVGAITVILKDDATERWAGDFDGFHPISCGTSIVLNFSGAGDAYIIYE